MRNRIDEIFRKRSLKFYRDSLRVIRQLESSHQKTWYDYLRLKFYENRDIHDSLKLKRILVESEEELAWVQHVISTQNKTQP